MLTLEKVTSVPLSPLPRPLGIVRGESVGEKRNVRLSIQIQSTKMATTNLTIHLQRALEQHVCLHCSPTGVEIHLKHDSAATHRMHQRSNPSLERIVTQMSIRKYITTATNPLEPQDLHHQVVLARARVRPVQQMETSPW